MSRRRAGRVGAIAVGCLLAVWRPAAGFSCRFQPRRLVGVADVGESRFVQLEIDVTDFGGAECEVTISGRGRCGPVRHHTMGVDFALIGKCPAARFSIVDSSYTRRAGERIADVRLDIEFANGERCRIEGMSPALYFQRSPKFGGLLPSLTGTLACDSTIGSPGLAEFVGR